MSPGNAVRRSGQSLSSGHDVDTSAKVSTPILQRSRNQAQNRSGQCPDPRSGRTGGTLQGFPCPDLRPTGVARSGRSAPHEHVGPERTDADLRRSLPRRVVTHSTEVRRDTSHRFPAGGSPPAPQAPSFPARVGGSPRVADAVLSTPGCLDGGMPGSARLSTPTFTPPMGARAIQARSRISSYADGDSRSRAAIAIAPDVAPHPSEWSRHDCECFASCCPLCERLDDSDADVPLVADVPPVLDLQSSARSHPSLPASVECDGARQLAEQVAEPSIASAIVNARTAACSSPSTQDLQSRTTSRRPFFPSCSIAERSARHRLRCNSLPRIASSRMGESMRGSVAIPTRLRSANRRARVEATPALDAHSDRRSGARAPSLARVALNPSRRGEIMSVATRGACTSFDRWEPMQ